MKNKKISIITLSYNSAATIEQTIASIVEQTYKNIEYIIIDGGSTDGTVDIIKKYEDKIAYWVSEPDKGIYDAMNKGVMQATGDYIEIIGSDDCLCANDIIEKVVCEIDKEQDIISCCQYIVDEKNKKQKLYSNLPARDKSTYTGGMIPHASMFVRNKLLRNKLFDTSYKIAADYKFFLSCYYDENISFKFSNLYVAYFSSGGVSSTQIEKTRAEDERIYKELNIEFHEEKNVSIKQMVKEISKKLHIYVGIKTILDQTFRWKKHKCNNRICRWCGRKL